MIITIIITQKSHCPPFLVQTNYVYYVKDKSKTSKHYTQILCNILEQGDVIFPPDSRTSEPSDNWRCKFWIFLNSIITLNMKSWEGIRNYNNIFYIMNNDVGGARRAYYDILFKLLDEDWRNESSAASNLQSELKSPTKMTSYPVILSSK